MPREALDGANLIAAADLVVSAGGTMNREAAALGVPAASIYAGKWAAIDEQLAQDGRLQKLKSPADFQSLPLQKKSGREPRANLQTRAEVAKLILDES
jgi:predicted glycosyltransferase